MARRKKKKSGTRRVGKRVAAACRQAKRIFESLPPAAHHGSTYYNVLRECGVPAGEAKTIAGEWILERELEAKKIV